MPPPITQKLKIISQIRSRFLPIARLDRAALGRPLTSQGANVFRYCAIVIPSGDIGLQRLQVFLSEAREIGRDALDIDHGVGGRA
jgi:hypothetical protein